MEGGKRKEAKGSEAEWRETEARVQVFQIWWEEKKEEKYNRRGEEKEGVENPRKRGAVRGVRGVKELE